MPKIHTVNVRALAEFTLQRGDLVPAAQMIDRMNDGVKGHQQLQSILGPDWQTEASISREEEVGGIHLRIHGRADGISRVGQCLRVLEIKTTVREPGMIQLNDYPAHLAQGELYAYLICANEGIQNAEVTLSYYRLDGAENRFRRRYGFEDLREIFLRLAEPYAAWISALEDLKERSVPTMQSLRFPFDRYRGGQREMAVHVYRAMRDGNRALIEAPTGIGKTAASLFGALKALGRGEITAIFYLTARTTGRQAAEHALDQMRARGLMLHSVIITAKEKCCLLEKRECPGCPYASGYYERRREALREALEIEAADAAAIRALAQKHALCPYELSLDMSEQADVIICDYNYVFDPRIRLKRYFDQKSKVGLLIDEAHNLPERTQSMLSAELSGKRVEEVRRLIGRYEGRKSPTYRALTELLGVLTRELTEPESLCEMPAEYLTAAQNFADAAEQIGVSEPEAVQLMLDAAWFARAARHFDETRFRALILPDGKRITVRLWCFDPSEHLGRSLRRVGGTALFSATLSPINHYAHQLGLDADDTILQLESPFPSENLLTLSLPVSVKYADRARSLHAVVCILHAMVTAHPGNYLACFPSFAYLNQAYEYYRSIFPEDRTVRQTSFMSETARSDFIQNFQLHPSQSLLAFVVLGGVFAEGVDLPDDRLSGSAIVSTGIPQISFERALLCELYDDGFGTGYDVAYTYPGIRRVLQAAGRVIRTESDRGIVLLLDTRYSDEHIRELLPPHWNLERIKTLALLEKRLKDFWNDHI